MNSTAFCFDLDGTVTSQEILPLIAEEVDLAEEIGVLTQATINGLIPFEKSFRLRCRLLADVPISVVNAAVARVHLEEEIVAFIRNHADQCFIVSGNLDVWIAPLLQQIPCRFITSRADVEQDRLVGVAHILNKADAVRAVREEFRTVVAIGEGQNDVPMFEQADIGIAHGAVHTPSAAVVQMSDYLTLSGEGLCRLLNSL